MLVTSTLMFRLYGLRTSPPPIIIIIGPPPPPAITVRWPPPPPGPRPPPPRLPPRPPCPPGCCPPFAATASRDPPKPKFFEKRMFTLKKLLPWPKFRGMMALGSKPDTSQNDHVRPNSSHLAPSSPKVGRSVKSESLLKSIPRVILKGLPLPAWMNGLTDMAHGRLMFPPTRKKCRMSPD